MLKTSSTNLYLTGESKQPFYPKGEIGRDGSGKLYNLDATDMFTTKTY